MGLQMETRSVIHNITDSRKAGDLLWNLVSNVITVGIVTILILIWSRFLKFSGELTQSSPEQNFCWVQWYFYKSKIK